jgi:hypothetical protein
LSIQGKTLMPHQAVSSDVYLGTCGQERALGMGQMPECCQVAEALSHTPVGRALALQGTCTGEHGVGLHKMDFLVNETGDGAVEMMRTIKRALDPKNIMDQGKIFTL